MTHHGSYLILPKQIDLDQGLDLRQFCLSMNSPQLFDQLIAKTVNADNDHAASVESRPRAVDDINRDTDPGSKQELVVLNFRAELVDLGLTYVDRLGEGFEEGVSEIMDVLKGGGVGIFREAASQFKKKLEGWDMNELEILKRFAKIMLDKAPEEIRQVQAQIYSKVISACTKFAFEQRRAARNLFVASNELKGGILAAVKDNKAAYEEAEKAIKELAPAGKKSGERIIDLDRFAFKRTENRWEVIRVTKSQDNDLKQCCLR